MSRKMMVLAAKRPPRAEDWAKRATRAHTNLNAFASLVALIEGGVFYGSETHAATRRITAICLKQQAKYLREYDRAVARISTVEQEDGDECASV